VTSSDTVLVSLPDAALAALATAVEAGWLASSSPEAAFTSIVGEEGARVAEWLQQLESDGFTPKLSARLIAAVLAGRERDRMLMPELVMSGPDVAGVPTADTHSVVQSLFQQAESEVLIAGYAFYNGRALFDGLASRRVSNPNLRVTFHVDVPRRHGDTSSADAIILRYSQDFRERHWPWTPQPEVYFDFRALEIDAKVRASLHAKVVIIDRRLLFIGSANFTEAAQQRNIEIGVLCSVPYLAERVGSYFEGLRKSGQLRRLPAI
jgi:phosphatidylserine/phosphatidylglycerophosphate/cardiolipin synthase-like enzyme